MNQLKQCLRMLAVTITLMLPWSAQAMETFAVFGVITYTGASTFTVRDRVYRIHPAVKFSSHAHQKASDLRKGEAIYFRGNVLNGRYLVDYIDHPVDDIEE